MRLLGTDCQFMSNLDLPVITALLQWGPLIPLEALEPLLYGIALSELYFE